MMKKNSFGLPGKSLRNPRDAALVIYKFWKNVSSRLLMKDLIEKFHVCIVP